MREFKEDPALKCAGMDEENEKFTNWIKAALALRILREGLQQLVCKHMGIYFEGLKAHTGNNGHKHICDECTNQNLLPFHKTFYKCPFKSVRRCFCCDKNNRRICPKNICSIWYDEIVAEHVSRSPNFSNVKIDCWCENQWEIAKAFIPSQGYVDVESADETDINGLLMICMNATTIRTKIANIETFHRIHEIRNELFHSATCEIDSGTLSQYLEAINKLLDDGLVLLDFEDANFQEQITNARNELRQLEMSAGDYGRHISTPLKIELPLLMTDIKKVESKMKVLPADNGLKMLRLGKMLRISSLKHHRKINRKHEPFRDDTSMLEAFHKGETTSSEDLTLLNYAFKGSLVPKQKTSIEERNGQYFVLISCMVAFILLYQCVYGLIRQVLHTKESTDAVTVMILLLIMSYLLVLADDTTWAILDAIRTIYTSIMRLVVSLRPPYPVVAAWIKKGLKKSICALRKTCWPQRKIDNYKDTLRLAGHKYEAHAVIENKTETYKETYGRCSKELRDYCCDISKKIEESSDLIDRAWPAYDANDKNRIVICMITKRGTKISPVQLGLEQFDVQQRQIDGAMKEDACVLRAECIQVNTHGNESYTKLEETINETCSDLMDKHRYLSIISPSLLKSKHFGTDKASISENRCIVFYVPIKGYIHLDEESLPTRIGEWVTDVREGMFIQHVKNYNDNLTGPHNYHDNLRMGCAISNAEGGSGTVGGFVHNKSNEKCMLTCLHVLMANEEIQRVYNTTGEHRTPIDCYQPCKGTGDENENRVGELIHGVCKTTISNQCGVDAALVRIDQRHPVDGKFPDIRDDQYTTGTVKPVEFGRDKTVVKFGAASKFTKGKLLLKRSTIRLLDTSIRLTNQLEVIKDDVVVEGIADGDQTPRFSTKGDSGAFVFAKDDRAEMFAIAMVVGGTGGRSFVTPLTSILDSFDLSPTLMAFHAEVSSPLVSNETFSLIRRNKRIQLVILASIIALVAIVLGIYYGERK